MLRQILKELERNNAKLVAVSKTKPPEHIMRLYGQGQRIFGENRAQELMRKQQVLPSDIEWHMIGHLQSKKVRHIAAFVQLIHSVDSLKVLKEINKQAAKNNRIINCLLQFKIAREESKYGLDLESARQLLHLEDYAELKNIQILGVMGMATFTSDEEQIHREYRLLKDIFDKLKGAFFSEEKGFSVISMGMSGDYKIALAEGSTMVRIGSLIFGPRT